MQLKDAIFIHGLEGSSQGVKATLLRERYPHMLIPDFRGTLHDRMQSLESFLTGDEQQWLMIGSSFGGLMAALFAGQYPHRVRKLVLFAPALIFPDFVWTRPESIDVPCVIFHGRDDELIPLPVTRQIAEETFTQLDFRVVEDKHGLYETVHAIDWDILLSDH